MSVYEGVTQFVAWMAVGYCTGAVVRPWYRRRRERWLISGRWFGHGRLVIWGARRGDTTVGDPHDKFMEALRNAARFRGSWHTNHVHVSHMRVTATPLPDFPEARDLEREVRDGIDLSMKIDRLEP